LSLHKLHCITGRDRPASRETKETSGENWDFFCSAKTRLKLTLVPFREVNGALHAKPQFAGNIFTVEAIGVV
jgi:hypothetical protein